MDEFTDAMGTDELAPGQMVKLVAGDHTVLLARVGDAFYATQARCPHLGGDLAHGTLDGTVVTCPLHGSQFDLTDGSVLRWTEWSGALETIGEALRHPRPLRTYEVRVVSDRVLVGPERAAASPDSSPKHSS